MSSIPLLDKYVPEFVISWSTCILEILFTFQAVTSRPLFRRWKQSIELKTNASFISTMHRKRWVQLLYQQRKTRLGSYLFKALGEIHSARKSKNWKSFWGNIRCDLEVLTIKLMTCSSLFYSSIQVAVILMCEGFSLQRYEMADICDKMGLVLFSVANGKYARGKKSMFCSLLSHNCCWNPTIVVRCYPIFTQYSRYGHDS